MARDYRAKRHADARGLMPAGIVVSRLPAGAGIDRRQKRGYPRGSRLDPAGCGQSIDHNAVEFTSITELSVRRVT
jgi:hypothetical protein